MESFLTTLISNISGLFPDTSLRSRRFLVFAGIVAIIFCFVFIEAQINYIYFWNLEERIKILRSLNELASTGVTDKPELRPIYEQIVGELKDREFMPAARYAQNISSLLVYLFYLPSFWKFMAGAIFGFTFSIIGLFQRSSNTAISAFMFGVIFGTLGYFLPVIYRVWVNVIVLTTIQLVILFAFNRRRKRSARQVVAQSSA